MVWWRYSVTCAFAAAATAVAQTPTIRGVGDLPGGRFMSTVTGVSADGSIVSGFAVTDRGNEAFRWTASEGIRGLGAVAGDPQSDARDVSGNGAVIVGGSYVTQPFGEAVRWTAGGGANDIGSLPGSNVGGGAFGTNADGSVVVGASGPPGSAQAFRWTVTGGMQGLGDLPGGLSDSFARRVTPNGSVVVGWGTSPQGTEAFRWAEAAGMQGLGDLPGGQFLSDAYDASADGSVVVGWSISAQGMEAFRWTAEGGMVGLGYLPGGSYSSGAATLSADGSAVYGASSTGPGNSRGFVWDAVHGMRDLEHVLTTDYGLDLTGRHQMGVAGVSDDGFTLAGNGINPAGDIEGFVIVLPEPGAALIPLAMVRWRWGAAGGATVGPAHLGPSRAFGDVPAPCGRGGLETHGHFDRARIRGSMSSFEVPAPICPQRSDFRSSRHRRSSFRKYPCPLPDPTAGIPARRDLYRELA